MKPIERFTTIRLADGAYELRASQPGNHMAYWSLYPNGFCDDNELGRFEQTIRFADPAPGKRVYFHIMTDGSYSVTAQRLGMLPSLPNLRDIGGYETEDGTAFVKYGLFYRSDRLCSLSASEREAFEKLGIRLIVDFRVANEIEGREDPEFAGIEYLNTQPIAQKNKCFHYTYADLVAGSTDKALDSAQALAEQYRVMAFGSAAYRELFARIAAHQTPLLFHCSAGKDRTGVAAALILRLLGVPRETIVYDYLLTREACAASIQKTMDSLRGMLDAHPELGEAIESFLSVRQPSIESTLDELDSRYPNVEQYFVQELGLTSDQLADIRRTCLTKHIEKKEG